MKHSYTASLIALSMGCLSACGGSDGTPVIEPPLIVTTTTPPPPPPQTTINEQVMVTAIFESNTNHLGWEYIIENSQTGFNAAIERAKSNNLKPEFIDVKRFGDEYTYTLITTTNYDGVSWSIRINETASQYEASLSEMKSKNYRPEAIDVDYVNYASRYSSIWVSNDDNRNWQLALNQDQQGYENFIDYSKFNNQTPTILDIDIVNNKQTFSGISETIHSGWQLNTWMSLDDFNLNVEEQKALGRHPVYIDVDMSGQELRFSTIWLDNINGLGWYVIPYSDIDEFNSTVTQLKAQNYRPVLIKTCRPSQCSQ
ncbi:hypothetical protein [Aliiglaciecola lipolytica]|uniref:Uncharacterized protein n=1 Tax=Aliiglaciecola lipolytica E3 TaxID=1127673 RepID=K6XQ96_9ALTE|nr:hypothetical protein [Aliiglaciecola lipolytica]GAC13836.1 hypothetical protein GLIP_1195 [Aliiglaciecola lipolytica E3]